MKLRWSIALLVFLFPGQGSWAADPPKRLLLLDSFGRNVVPTRTLISAFRMELSSRSPQPIDLLEISLEMARFAEAEREVPFVNLLQEAFPGHIADLVASASEPASPMIRQRRSKASSPMPTLPCSLGLRASSA